MTQVPFWSTFRAIDSRAGERWPDLPLLSVSQFRGVIPRSEIDDAEARAQDLSIYKTCRVGDLVLNRMSAYKGAVGVAPIDGLVSPDYLVMRPTETALAHFLAYMIKTPWFVGEMTRLVRGIGSVDGSNVRTPRIGAAELGSIKVSLPSLEAQHLITTYLDQETAEIDAFIADQEELIWLLAERRAATISHAVTKGLDATVPLRDSGAEWIGAIPQHWQAMPLKRAVLRIDQGVSPQAEGGLADGGAVGVLRAGCVNRGVFNDREHKRLADDFKFNPAIRVRVGDLIVNRASGSPSLVGSAARVRALDYDLILSDKTFRLNPRWTVNADFLELYLNSDGYRRQVLSAISGAEGLANNLPMSALKEMALALPPVDEQTQIVSVVREELLQLDGAITDAREAIALSRERRAALISAAVTGKIDVRERARSEVA